MSKAQNKQNIAEEETNVTGTVEGGALYANQIKTDKIAEASAEPEEKQPIDVTRVMKKIMLPRPRPGEEKSLMVGYNGKNYQIIKGIEVEVPYGVAEIINNAYKAEEERYLYEDIMEERASKF